MLTFLAFDTPPSYGEDLTILQLILGFLLAILFMRGLIFLTSRSKRKNKPVDPSDISEDEVFNFLVQLNRRRTMSAKYIARKMNTDENDRVLFILRSLARQGKIRRISDTCSDKEEFGIK